MDEIVRVTGDGIPPQEFINGRNERGTLGEYLDFLTLGSVKKGLRVEVIQEGS
jgi:hypothetical protein